METAGNINIFRVSKSVRVPGRGVGERGRQEGGAEEGGKRAAAVLWD